MPTNYEVVTVDGERSFPVKSVLRIPKNWTPTPVCSLQVAPPGGIANVPAAIKATPVSPDDPQRQSDRAGE